MAAVTVNLPKSRAAVFPTRCIDCGAANPDSTWRVCTHAIGWWTVAFQSFGKRFCVEAPACEGCRKRLRRGALARAVIGWGLIFAGIGLGLWSLGQPQGFWGKWAVIGLGLAALLPLFAWEMVFPPALDLTAYSQTVDYDFRDAAYAEEFRALNPPEPESAEPPAAADTGAA